MKVIYDHDRLVMFILRIHELTHIWVRIYRSCGEVIPICDVHTEFCQAVNAVPDGRSRCMACASQAARICRRTGVPYHYRCHAGIQETLIPIIESGETVSFLGFGQYLDESPMEESWKQTKELLSWYPGSLEELQEKFMKLEQIPDTRAAAVTALLEDLSSHTKISEKVIPVTLSAQQRLESYISRHFREKLNLRTVCSELDIGTTKLCELTKIISNGHTFTWLVSHYRVSEAQMLLFYTDDPISEIAEKVGYGDYSYFSHVFKKMTGYTPRQYRSRRIGPFGEKSSDGEMSGSEQEI